MKLVFMGDSTMQYNDCSTYPQVGWPQALPLFLNKKITIKNFAHNGCSTKSFQTLGYYQKAINCLQKGDYCFIQFGHNDAKIDNPLRYTDPYTTYTDNLIMFINDIIKKEAIPVLLTSIYRRHFDENNQIKENCHLDYPKAMIDVAKKKNVLVIDLCTLTKNKLQSLGDEGSKHLFMNFPAFIYANYPEGMNDNTHLRFDGAYEITKIFVQQLFIINHPLKEYFINCYEKD